MPDGTQVAVIKFKNCYVSDDANFAHELEVIASYLNLVALRGYSTATTNCKTMRVTKVWYNNQFTNCIVGQSFQKLSFFGAKFPQAMWLKENA